MSNANWITWIEECRKQELPCVPTGGEPWFSATFIASNFLMIEKVDAFIRDWKDCNLPILRIKRHPLIKFSDIERFGLEQSTEDEDGISDPIPAPREESDSKPRKSKKA